MKRWKVILATVVIFATGLVTGALLVKTTQSRAASQTLPPAIFLRGPYYIQRQFLGRMKDELDLSPEQVQRLETVFAETRERLGVWRDVLAPEIEAELKEVRNRIRAELTPRQWQDFEELLRQNRGRATGGGAPGTGAQGGLDRNQTNRPATAPSPGTKP